MKRVLRAMGAFFLHGWPQKLGAFLAAMLVWWFATVGDTPQTQASRVVDLEVQGLGSTSVASGLPDSAVITIRGPSVLIDRLQAQSLGAIIDLEGRTGAFEEAINVMIPQGVELVSVTPSEVIGSVETLSEASVPVEPVLIGGGNPDVRAVMTVEPDQVMVSGLASVLTRVSRVVVPVRAAAGDRNLAGFAADLSGLPVAGVSVLPAEVLVTVVETPVLTQRDVTVQLIPPAVDGFNVSARLEAAEVSLVGPPSLLAAVEQLRASPDLSGMPRSSGSHSVPVVMELPEGVTAPTIPTAIIRLTPLSLEE